MIATPLQEALDLQRENVIQATHTVPFQQVSDYYSKLSVAGIVADVSACGYYRILNPLHYFRMFGADVYSSSVHSMSNLERYNAILVPRQHNPDIYESVRQLAWGKLLIYELDDNLHTVLKSSPAYYAYHPGSLELKMVPKFMQACHGVTVTTPEIARYYYPENQNIAIVENYIDFCMRDWSVDVKWSSAGQPTLVPKPIPRRPEWDNKIVIGYSGGTTHQEDIQQIGSTLSVFLHRYPNTVLAMNTSLDMYLEFKHRYQIPDDQIFHIPATHFLDHPPSLNGIDISLAPILGCEFNLSKSSLKILESMAKGSTVVASNVGPYARFASRHPGMVSLVGRGKNCHASWGAALRELVENPEYLRQRKIEGRKLIMDHYAMETNFHKWLTAWERINKQSARGEIGPPVLPTNYQRLTWGRTGRNDKCPCGSGKSYKSCCVDAWG